MKFCRGTNHFIDTNVLLRHANRTAENYAESIDRILSEAAEGKRKLWVSTILFAELRPSNFLTGGIYESVDELSDYIVSIAEPVAPDPVIAQRAARLRDCVWQRGPKRRQENEKPRNMSLGDALHIASALWVKETFPTPDLEFLTFDDGKSRTDELDPGTGSLSILRLEEFTADLSGHEDVQAVVRLARVRPMIAPASEPGLFPQ